MKKKATSNKSLTDWKRVRAMREPDIDLSDIPELTPEMFVRAIVRRGLKPKAPSKVQLTVRVDPDVLALVRVAWTRLSDPDRRAPEVLHGSESGERKAPVKDGA